MLPRRSNNSQYVDSHGYLRFPVGSSPVREVISCFRVDPSISILSKAFSSDRPKTSISPSKSSATESQLPPNEGARRVRLKRHVATRLPFVDAFLLKMKKEKVLLANKKIWSHRSVIIPEFVGYTVRIYNGRTFVHYTRSRSLFRVSTTAGKKKGKK
ncbi:uncharacterized protein LOC131168878 [Hevea brasiliensis]|uniref:uncharacterized protein LOC131168878 n=1 Tax=Hevea brasiliensis TaxID=3981 RepID=UPI002600B86C|nr:uncharacterized protein LOC131168878 [Hevea brasiliensis]XP_057998871.1 uncharacterized protein LOC131168878 [Hevea brasiliensis]XP_057998872.1 uncharacterized protein LOC131168878 [Hevea brasiliensis]